MQNQLCVSSYSLRQHLGPIRVMMRGADGKKAPFIWEQPQTMSLLEFPLCRRLAQHTNCVSPKNKKCHAAAG